MNPNDRSFCLTLDESSVKIKVQQDGRHYIANSNRRKVRKGKNLEKYNDHCFVIVFGTARSGNQRTYRSFAIINHRLLINTGMGRNATTWVCERGELIAISEGDYFTVCGLI